MPSSIRGGDDDRDTLVSVAQAAALLGVHPNTIRSWTDAGRLSAYRINTRGDRRFRRSDLELLLSEGSQPAEHAHTAAPQDPDRRDVEIAVLTRLAEGSGGSSPVAVCRLAVDTLRTQLAYDRVAIYLASGRSMRLETHAGYRVAPPASIGRRELDELARTSAQPVGIGGDAETRVPVRAGGKLVAVLVVSGPDGAALTETDRTFLGTVANVLGVAIQTARTLGGARQELTRSRTLHAITQQVVGRLDLPAVLDEVVDRSRSLFDADKVGLWLLTDAEPPFQLGAARGISDGFLAGVRGISLESPAIGVRAVVDKRTFVVQDASTDPSTGPLHDLYVAEGIETACLVPLVSNDRSVGVLGLYHVTRHDWPPDELSLAQALGNQTAIAISNARLYRSTLEQGARMRSIQDLSARLNRLTDVTAIAEAITAEASTLAEYHDIRVYEVDHERGVCEPIAFTRRLLGDGGDFVEKLRVDVGPGSFTGTVAATGRPLLINDTRQDARGVTIAGTDEVEESMLLVPMVYEGRTLGVVSLSKLGIGQFTTDDLQTMTIFAGYAAQAIANATAYAKLELQSTELARQLQSQRRLLDINERLLSTLDREIVLDTIADGLRSVVRYDNLSIYRADELRTVLAPVLTRERHAEQVRRYNVPFGHGLMGWAVDHAEPVLANDALNDPRAMQIPGTPADPEALVVVPLSADGDVIGCMNISRVGGQEAHFSQADFELVKLFAGQASLALRNAEEHQRMTVRADTDALTGLGNHGAFQRTLGELLGQPEQGTAVDARRAVDTDTPLALVMMDLDNFKSYNDRLGHPAGDRLLHAVGTAIYGTARTDDLVFRYGGDEFVLILSGADTEVAVRVAERVAASVAVLTAQDQTSVTMSVGIAAYPGDATDKNELIALADTALYYGKQSGGNRIVPITEVPREMRELRSTLDRLARVALQHPEDPGTVDSLVAAAQRSADQDEEGVPTRDALLNVARSLDGRDAATVGHGDRVGRLARRVAAQLHMAEDMQSSVELAARLHGFDALGSEELDAIPSLRDVSRILRAHHAAEGSETMQEAAQIVAVANAYDMLLTGAGGTRLGRRAALERLRVECPETVTPKTLAALGAVVGVAPRKDRHRRAKDAAPEAEATA